MIAAYGFQKRWRGKLAKGKKRMTIRARRKDGRLPKPGDTFRGYVGIRTKNCELVVEGVVERVRVIWIRRRVDSASVSIVGFMQRKAEVLALAKSDGFESAEDFFAWFLPAGREDFEGHIIEWRPR